MSCRRVIPPYLSRSMMGAMRLAIVLLTPWLLAAQSAPQVQKIWDGAPHNAFTDLIRYEGRLFCVFREAAVHGVSPDGKIRVLRSRDGGEWTSVALLESGRGDLRDPHLSITPQGELMLVAAIALNPGAGHRHQTYAFFSRDGAKWSEPVPIGDPDYWLWRVAWHRGKAYAVGYPTNPAGGAARLYHSEDGRKFRALVAEMPVPDAPNETAFAWLPDDTMLILARRGGGAKTAALLTARPPYTEWKVEDLGQQLGGPALVRLPNGRLLAAGRIHPEGGTRTALLWLDREGKQFREIVVLPSKGDSSYPGLVWEKGELLVSYYSSHEGKSSIYFARVGLK